VSRELQAGLPIWQARRHRLGGLAALLAGGALAVTTLAACGGAAQVRQQALSALPEPSQAPNASKSSAPPSTLPSSAPASGCDNPLSATDSVPDPESVVAVRDCAVAPQGNMLVRSRRQADDGLGPLLDALTKTPSPEPLPPGVVAGCGAKLDTLPDLQLVLTDGSTVQPRLPMGACGPATPALLSAYRLTPFRKVLEQTPVGTIAHPPNSTASP